MVYGSKGAARWSSRISPPIMRESSRGMRAVASRQDRAGSSCSGAARSYTPARFAAGRICIAMILTILKSILIIIEVLLIFNLMIIVHELGHFLAGRWRGLVIEKFGIWFGTPIWKKKIGGVEYSLGSIP